MLAQDVKEIAVFDTETSGIDVENDRVVTAFLGIMDASGKWVDKESWLIDPGVEIPQGAIDVHGVTNERARAEGAKAATGIAEILGFLESTAGDRPLVAYNAAFDLSLMKYEAQRHGYAFNSPSVVIDPFVIDKQLDKYRKGKRTLTVTAAHYGVDIGENAHDAEADCAAAGKLAFKMLHTNPLGPLQLDYIHGRQIVYAAEQAAGLQEYFRRKDPTAVVDGRWPIR